MSGESLELGGYRDGYGGPRIEKGGTDVVVWDNLKNMEAWELIEFKRWCREKTEVLLQYVDPTHLASHFVRGFFL